MTTLFKKLDITGVAVLILTFVVAVGFTAAKEMRQEEWYAVEIEGDPSELVDQKIGEHLPNGPDGDCLEEDGTICAVQLTIPSGPFPANMQEATDFTNVQIDNESYRN